MYHELRGRQRGAAGTLVSSMNTTKTLRWCRQIGLTVLTMTLAGRASAAVDCALDGGPVEFGAVELDAALLAPFSTATVAPTGAPPTSPHGI